MRLKAEAYRLRRTACNEKDEGIERDKIRVVLNSCLI